MFTKNFKINLSVFALIVVCHVSLHSESKDTKTANPDPKNQTQSTGEDAEGFFTFTDHSDNQTSMEIFNKVYEHRLMLRGGWGVGKLSPAILNETSQAWFLNSILRQISEPGTALAIPYKDSKDLDVNSQFMDIRYGYLNKYEIQYAIDTTLGVYSRNLPASNNFFSPRSDTYWGSTFEGNRLLRFQGVSEHFRFSYTHPVSKIWMIGPSINFHRYTETNNISYGSYSTSRPEAAVPNKVTWSIGGDANAEYSMRGIVPGIYSKWKLRDWWEVRARFELLDRRGNFSVIGSQIISERFDDGREQITGVLPAYGGKVRDRGTILNLESSFQYCRFTLDFGIIRQDIRRKYETYLGDTIGSVPRNDYSARSVGIGFSEMSSSIKHTVTEVYIMPSVSFFYDADGVY
ncbi:MAG: hypothetical protein O9301_15020 [Leptospira sp.]|nr:hypothetical protein [Leptospira sp.]